MVCRDVTWFAIACRDHSPQRSVAICAQVSHGAPDSCTRCGAMVLWGEVLYDLL